MAAAANWILFFLEFTLQSIDLIPSFEMSASEEVSRLRDSAFFNEATILLLEKFVKEEAASTAVYNAKANRGLLKLYQMYPTRLNVENVALILVKVHDVYFTLFF